MVDYDRRLVELYDEDNPDGPDHDFYRDLADTLGAQSIVDLGCGTGILTTTLAQHARLVVGVDPSANMLAYARQRIDASKVRWILGDSRNLPAGPFDFALMTGNVAQHIPEGEWQRTLSDLRSCMRDGGTLAFESRNPEARAWLNWAGQGRIKRNTMYGQLVEWLDATEISPGVVNLVASNHFEFTDETVTEVVTLYFRSRYALEGDLTRSRFEVQAVYGGWGREPLSDLSPMMIFIAKASSR